MKKIFLINFLLLMFCMTSFAQSSLKDQVTNAQFQMIKESVRFMAGCSDKATDIKTVEKAKSYQDLLNYATTQKLTLKKLDVFIKKYKDKPVTADPENYKTALIDFKIDIIDGTTGTPEKKFRTTGNNKSKFTTYQKELDNIIAFVVPPKAVEEDLSTNSENGLADNYTNEEGLNSVDSSKKNAQAVGEEQTTEDGAKSSSSMFSTILLYVLAAVSLAGLFLLFRFIQVKIQDQDKKLKGINEGFSMDFKRLQNEVQALKTDNRTTSESILTLKDELSKRINNLAQNNASQQSQQNKVAIAPTAAKPEPVIKFAKYADQGDGFSASELLNEEDNETIFELEMLYPGTAKLRIARNINAQHYALTNATYFLAKVCKYDSVPSNNSSIRTEIPGELKLIGNKWVIVTPSKISFY